MDDCGSRSTQLEQLLTEYQTRLELDNPDSEFTEVHSFGPYNFHKEHNKFKTLLNGILSRCKQCKSWSNSKQAVKSFGDRQQQIKLLLPLKNYLAECLDKLQSVILENNLTDTIHHLEMITRQVGLKFDVSTTYTECFISSDMFYVEVQLEENGNILEVKVAHAGESVTSPVLTTILRCRDYNEFLKHMQGLANLYQLSGDAFQKSKIFLALVTLEKDLEKIAHSDDGNQNSFEDIVLRGAVGVVTPRQGGQLMRLTYFAKPLELRGNNVPTLDDLHALALPEFGRSLSISVEQSKSRLLPTSSLFSDTRNAFLPINETNSEELPASFVLRLDKPLVVSASVLERMHSVLENFKGETFVQNSKAHLDCLIIKKWLKERKMEYRSQMAYRQTLPGGDHIYRITEGDIQGSLLQNDNIGVVISRIPFTHCKNMLEIIQLLRQQLVYNELLTSVLSSQPMEDEGFKDENVLCFDVGTCSPFTVVVTFQEPITFSLASVEFQVKHDCSIDVRFKFSPRKTVFYDCGYVARVVQRCLSIPVTMKYIFKKGRNVQSGGDYKMTVNDNSEVSKRNFTTPPNQGHTQTNAATFLSLMIGNTDSPMSNTNSVLSVPLLSPSPTLPNFLTPSPTRSNFSFPGQDRPDTGSIGPENITGKQENELTRPRPSIKIKLKKVASSDKYVIETPRSVMSKLTTTMSSMDTTPTMETSGMTSVSQYQTNTVRQEHLLQPSNISDQQMEFSSPQMQFGNLDNFGTSLLGNPTGVNIPDASGVADVENIFQTLPGGATGSPGGLDVDNPYGFDSGLVDSTFDIDAEIEAANVTGVATDATSFDIGNVYDPGASTSSSSAMVGSFDIDSTFDLDTILATSSQSSDSSVNGGISLDWNLGNDAN